MGLRDYLMLSLELGIAIASVGIAGDNVQGAQAQDEVADHQEVGLC